MKAAVLRNTRWSSVRSKHQIHDEDYCAPSKQNVSAAMRDELESVQSSAESFCVYDGLLERVQKGGPDVLSELKKNE